MNDQYFVYTFQTKISFVTPLLHIKNDIMFDYITSLAEIILLIKICGKILV